MAERAEAAGPGPAAMSREELEREVERLRAVEARATVAAAALPDGLAIFDAEDRIVYWNARYPEHLAPSLRAELALGLRFDDWIGRGLARGPIYHADMGPDFAGRRIALRRRGVGEHEHRLADGRWVRIRERRTPDGGRILLTTDVTEQHRQAAEIRMLARAVEQVVDPVEITDEAHRFVYVNRAFEATTGWSRAEALGREPQELLSSGRHPPEFFAAMQARLEAGESWQGTIVNRHRDGHLIEQETTISPLRGEAGVPVRYVAVKRDVTEARAQARALAASEARYRAVVETQTELVVRVDRDGRWTFMNEACQRYLGRTMEELNAAGLRDPLYLHPEDLPIYRAHLAAMTPESPTHSAEWRALHPDGREHWEQWTDTALFDEAGRLVELQCVGRIVDERKAAERELAEREAQFRTIAENVPVGLVISDVETARPYYINPLARARLGLGPDELPESLMDVWLDPADRRALMDELARTGTAAGVEAHLVRPDGGSLIALVSGTRIRYGGRDALLAATVDITDLRATEAALKASEARLNAIIAANPTAMNIARLSDRRLLFVNRPYIELFGLEGVDLETFDRDSLYEDAAERDRIFAEIAAGGEVTNRELMLRRADATPLPVSITSRRVDFQGEPALVTTSIDLTSLRAAEAELARSREALHQSEKMTALGSLLAGVAHELNNPLSIVVGYASMLRDLAETPEMRARLDRLHAAADRCARIVRTFLAMARARPPRRGPVDLAEVVAGALDLAAYGLRSADVAVEVALEDGLPPAWGDADQLHQVVANLVVNAQQALLARPAPRRLSIRARRAGAEVELELADNGPGMAPEVAKRAFDPFFTTKPQGVGTGVGLSVCHGIAAAHGGSIALETAPGEGARFRLRLPAGGAEAEAAGAAAAAGVVAGRVLVVDDEPDIGTLLAETLGAAGLGVEVAASGRAALAALAGGGFDAVVTDLRMPDIDGAALTAAILARHPALAGRIVLITGDALGAELAPAPGVARVFEKPLDLAALTDELRRLIAGSAAP